MKSICGMQSVVVKTKCNLSWIEVNKTVQRYKCEFEKIIAVDHKVLHVYKYIYNYIYILKKGIKATAG